MKFSEFKNLCNEIIELNIDIQEIEKEEYNNLPVRQRMNYNISSTLNKIENLQNVDEEYFSKEANEIINEKRKEIRNIKDYLSKTFGDWTRFFWIDVKLFEERLNTFLKNAQLEPRFTVELDEEQEQNFITGEMVSKGQLKIESTNGNRYIIDVDGINYDFSDIQNLIVKAVRRNQKIDGYVKLSPNMLISTQWQEFESLFLPDAIRKIYWNTVRESIKRLDMTRQDLLNIEVENNEMKIEKLKMLIAELKNNSRQCIDKSNVIKNNPEIIINE